jgi:hypothetical protein
VREGKKSTPVTLSMSLTGVRENLSNLDMGEGSWTGRAIKHKYKIKDNGIAGNFRQFHEMKPVKLVKIFGY